MDIQAKDIDNIRQELRERAASEYKQFNTEFAGFICCLSLPEFHDYADTLFDRYDEEALEHLPLSYDEAISIGALYRSMAKCRRNVSWKTSVLGYTENGLNKISALHFKLANHLYYPKPPRHFKVYSPKPRDIVATAFEDRVVQRSFNDNIIYPIMTRSFIDANCACQKGKGTDYGRDLLKKYLYRCYCQEHDNDLYYLQVDIHGYYPNMRHDYVEKLFRDKLDQQTMGFVKMILDSQYPGDIGYNPGSQLIQIAGISVLDNIDHWTKEQKHLRYYVRYMDDIIILHRDKNYLQQVKQELQAKLGELGFTFNPNKTKIRSIRNKDIPFLGFKYSITNTGKILVKINPETIKRDYRHWAQMSRAIINNKYAKLNVEKLIDSINSTIRYIEKHTSHNIKIVDKLLAIRKYYQEVHNYATN